VSLGTQQQPARESRDSSAEPSDLWRLRGMRVAVVVFSHYPSDPRPRRAAEALVRLGMRVDVVCLRQDEKEPLRETCNGVGILRIPLQHRRGGKLSYLFEYGTFILAAFLVLSFRTLTRGYRLVHVHNMPDVLVFSALLPKLLGAKVILDLHDPMPELVMTIFGLNPEARAVCLLRWLEKSSARFADVVLTPNAAFEKLFTGRSCNGDKLHVIMNSPDEGIFRFQEAAPPNPGPGKLFKIMYHGALVERHGLDLAVLALETVRRSVPNAQLRIYGRSTPFLENVMDMVRSKGLQDAVQYLGPMSLPQIAEAIDECDLGIIPNRRSMFTELNMPTRIFEYLSRGKPVLAPRTSGIQDYFSEEEIIFFELGNADDLAQKIQYAHSQPAEVTKLIKRGQEVYLAHRWSKESARFVSQVAQVVQGVRTSGLYFASESSSSS
jgi:glycosyltransferase involved in cell wall biosynthesis